MALHLCYKQAAMIDTPPQALVIARALRMEGDREAPGNLAINKVMAAAGTARGARDR